MSEELLFEIGKWTVLVFLAGFIGYFGKHLGKVIIAAFSRETSEKDDRPLNLKRIENQADSKADKKIAKALIKAKKKAAKGKTACLL